MLHISQMNVDCDQLVKLYFYSILPYFHTNPEHIPHNQILYGIVGTEKLPNEVGPAVRQQAGLVKFKLYLVKKQLSSEAAYSITNWEGADFMFHNSS